MCLVIKKPAQAAWMQVEILMLNKSDRERQIPYDITYIWNLIYGTNEPIYRKETNSGTWRTDLWLPRWGGGSGMDWEFGVSRCKLLHLEWIGNEIPLYRPRDYI